MLSRWFKKKDPQLLLLETIEQHYGEGDAFRVAKAAREQDKLDPFTFVYGEITSIGMYCLLKKASPQSGDIFYDLGSGSGKAVMTAALCFPEIEARGIEFIEPMQQLSQQLAQNLLDKLNIEQKEANFICTDLHSYDLSDATILFINATGYFDEAYEDLIDTLLQVETGTRIIISSKQLPEQYFEHYDYFLHIPMSWGECQVNLYRRR